MRTLWINKHRSGFFSREADDKYSHHIGPVFYGVLRSSWKGKPKGYPTRIFLFEQMYPDNPELPFSTSNLITFEMGCIKGNPNTLVTGVKLDTPEACGQLHTLSLFKVKNGAQLAINGMTWSDSLGRIQPIGELT